MDSVKARNFGDCKVLDDGIREKRIDFGPGYRVYYAQEGRTLFLLLAGNDKSSQKRDMAKAKDLWRAIREEKT